MQKSPDFFAVWCTVLAPCSYPLANQKTRERAFLLHNIKFLFYRFSRLCRFDEPALSRRNFLTKAL